MRWGVGELNEVWLDCFELVFWVWFGFYYGLILVYFWCYFDYFWFYYVNYLVNFWKFCGVLLVFFKWILCLQMFTECFIFGLFRDVLRDVCWVLRNRCTTSQSSCVRKQKILCKPAPAYAENQLPDFFHLQLLPFCNSLSENIFQKVSRHEISFSISGLFSGGTVKVFYLTEVSRFWPLHFRFG